MHLIDNWRDWWRFWSVRLQILGLALISLLEMFPDAFLAAWAVLPMDLRIALPPEVLRWIGYACLALVPIARVVKQRRLERAAAPDDQSRAVPGGSGPH